MKNCDFVFSPGAKGKRPVLDPDDEPNPTLGKRFPY